MFRVIIIFVLYFGDVTTFHDSIFSRNGIYLTLIKNKIVMNWKLNATPSNRKRAIILTNEDPRINPHTKNLTVIEPNERGEEGYKVTNHTLKRDLPGGWSLQENHTPVLEPQCNAFYITTLENGEFKNSSCYNIQPTWMENFGNMRIGDMMIPGTHNSGTFSSILPSFLGLYVRNQDHTLYEQLIDGIRYFDIRIGIYGSTPNKIYINHDIIRCTKLIPQLETIVEFLKKSPKEIVILDFHRFPRPKNFTKDLHELVLQEIWKILGSYIYPYNNTNSNPKLSDFWKYNKRVIVSYGNREMELEKPWLWPKIVRKWPNTDDVSVLKHYIQHHVKQPSIGNPLWVLMAELTPTAKYVALHPHRGLRHLAQLINGDLTDWMSELTEHHANIIAADYYTGSNIVSYAIEENFRRSQKK